MEKLSTFVFYVTIYLLSVFTGVDSAFQVIGIRHWSYHGKLGPKHWCEIFKNESQCCGQAQSPINIVTKDVTVVTDHFLHVKGLDTNVGHFNIFNNGHAVLITINTTSTASNEINPNPRHQLLVAHGRNSDRSPKSPKIYAMDSLHFHFGRHSGQGSEHVINDQLFPMEIHLVFYRNKYASFDDAKNIKGALAVVAILTELSPDDNPSLAPLIQEMPNVAYQGQPHPLSNFVLRDLLPKRTDNYYFYTGSLTTPLCNEGVSWFIYKRKLPISEIQLSSFRQLTKQGLGAALFEGHKHHSNGWNFLSDNFRPIQDLNKRQVYENRPKIR